MRIAVISDIHGNIAALNAVLDDATVRNVDVTVNLGDICSGGLFPFETAARLMPLGLPTISGNHERQVLTLPPDRMGLSDRHAASNLKIDQIEWLANLPTTLRLFNNVLLVHGTPESDLAYFLETVTEEGVRPATEDEVKARTAGVDADVILCGHTHLPRTMTLDCGRLIVNPGSVGLPAYEDDHPYPHVIENGSPHARYAIVTKANGRWSAELLSIDYDWDKAAQDALANGRSDWARALLSGSV